MSEDNTYDAWFEPFLEAGGALPSVYRIANRRTTPISYKAPKFGVLRVKRLCDGYVWYHHCEPGDVRTVSADGIPKPALLVETPEVPPSYPGLEYVGTAYGQRFLVGDEATCQRTSCYMTTLSACDSDSHWATSLRDGRYEGKEVAVIPEVLAKLDSWAEWTERVCVNCREHLACKQYKTPNGESHDAVCRGRPQEVSAAPYLGLGTEGQLVDRHPPKAPPPQPILEVADGRVSLHLERLVEDNTKARRQLHEAMDAVYKGVVQEVSPRCLYNIIGDMTLSLFRSPGWPRARHLSAIEDAVHRLAVAQCQATRDPVAAVPLGKAPWQAEDDV